MLKDIIILLLIVYLVYKVLTRFILPILNVTAAANTHVRKMQEQMNAQMQEMERQKNQQASRNKVEKEGDYIDYEEIK
jgi:predicted Holliday junction resolvase-like endonuclease